MREAHDLDQDGWHINDEVKELVSAIDPVLKEINADDPNENKIQEWINTIKDLTERVERHNAEGREELSFDTSEVSDPENVLGFN